ncbi:adenylate kinase-domain-containing protein [Glomus cerebriforme]|uniref:GTP:AMP phosphotransferase, mitochondrial n=1 Tax=Glomus cerebriforme TaxID=658196 RepID=A0A397SWY1_9GLOM|nr:adenylate kinase-domain-containing protein [Glomus cerebriforme]
MRSILTNLLQQKNVRYVKSTATVINRYVIFDCHNKKKHFGSTCVNHASPTTEKLPMHILLLGSPGAGKGTQSFRIQKNFDISAITSGNLLRQNIANGTTVGKLVAKHMEHGTYVPDDIMIELIAEELQRLKHQNWLLDGFPRTINQATALDDNLNLSGQPLNLVINLHVPEEVILQRIMDRWVHVPSGRVYNLSYNPPKIHGLDDITGEKLTKRTDDNPETFKIRLQKHHALTEPLLEYYDKQNILINCTGRTSDEIYPQIESELIARFKVIPHKNQVATSTEENFLNVAA